MSAKHTPGPWTVGDKPSGWWWHIHAAPSQVTGGQGRQAIATAHATSKRHSPIYAEMFRANAQLMAAAPEMFDVLATIKAVIQAGEKADIELMFCMYSPLREALYAAIAKATGDQT